MTVLTKFSKREHQLLIATVLIVSTTFIYGFVIEPLTETYRKIGRETETSVLKLQKSYKLLQQADIIETEYNKYAATLKRLPSDEEEMASMLKAIELTARKNNIRITNIRPQPIKDRVYYREFVFELVCEVDASQVVKFMYDLQTTGNLLRASRVTLTTGSGKDKMLKAIMEITKPSIRSVEI